MTSETEQNKQTASESHEKQAEPGLDKVSDSQKAPTTKPCGDPKTPGGNPNAPYALPGPQVEFAAAYWWINSKLRMPTIDQIKKKLGGKLQPYPRDGATLTKEIKELKDL